VFAHGEDPAFPDDAVEVGRVVGAWGVKGGIRIKPFSADPQALFSTKRWFLLAPDTPTAPAAARPGPVPKASAAAAARAKAATATPPPRWPRLVRVAQAREQGDHIVATLHDLDDRDAAQALAGARVFISRASFPTPAADEFYWVDLIGLAVQNREGLELGTIAGLIETGPTCVLRVQPPPTAAATATSSDEGPADDRDAGDGEAGAPRERLIPFVSAYVDRVDLAGRCVHVDWQPDF